MHYWQALHIIKARYASSPQKSYFAGGSTGGREALAAIQRWPADWDGAIAWYPAWNDAAALLGGSGAEWAGRGGFWKGEALERR